MFQEILQGGSGSKSEYNVLKGTVTANTTKIYNTERPIQYIIMEDSTLNYFWDKNDANAYAYSNNKTTVPTNRYVWGSNVQYDRIRSMNSDKTSVEFYAPNNDLSVLIIY